MTVVRRSAVRMWLIAIGSLPLLLIAIDVLFERRITNWLREIVFTPEDTQIYEPRDVIYAWAIFLFSAGLVLWGMKELFLPTKVIECRQSGLALKLRGPFRSHDVVPWSEVVDVETATIEDDGDALPSVLVSFLTRAGLPEHPWGARWVEERSLGIMAQDWSKSPAQVVDEITDFAIAVARDDARDRAARHLRTEEE